MKKLYSTVILAGIIMVLTGCCGSGSCGGGSYANYSTIRPVSNCCSTCNSCASNTCGSCAYGYGYNDWY